MSHMFSYLTTYRHKLVLTMYYLCNVIRKTNFLNVIQSEAKDLGYIHFILPRFFLPSVV